ncbi:transposase [Nocardia takedensis]|uniref:IS110 family transposase n=1 Tax=Nocardia takedensis TaxID=259390 RepID=UPI0002F08C89|nr:IS110 family transposase [Nocardia takedensis]
MIGRTGSAVRFPTAAAYATYTGTAPVEIAGADRRVHRLSRFGDRQLNATIHTVAMVQVRMPGPPAALSDRKIAEGSHHALSRTTPRRHHLADHDRRREPPTSTPHRISFHCLTNREAHPLSPRSHGFW